MISALHDCVAPILATCHESSPQVLLDAFEQEIYSILRKVIFFVYSLVWHIIQ